MLQRLRGHQLSFFPSSSFCAYRIQGIKYERICRFNKCALKVQITLLTTPQGRDLLFHSGCRYSTSQKNPRVKQLLEPPYREPLAPIRNTSGNFSIDHLGDGGRRAKDKILFKDIRREARRAPVQRGYGPWPGLKILHLDTAKSLHPSHSRDTLSAPALLSEWLPRGDLPGRLQFPWMSRLHGQYSVGSRQPAHMRLNQELTACKRYFESTEQEDTAASSAWVDIQAVIKRALGSEARIDLVGSRASGMSSPTSDIDINVQYSAEASADHDPDYMKQQLRHLDWYLRKPEFRNKIALHLYLRNAVVPIVAGTHIPSGLEFQIQCTTIAYDSLEVARAFAAEYPSACVLFKIVKQMLLMRGLTLGQSGLTSYPLLNMVVVSLKLATSRIETGDLATQLLHFLDFWSKFDYSKHKIVIANPPPPNNVHLQATCSIDPISAIPRIAPKVIKTGRDASLLSLEDPADTSNDLGRNATRIRDIQACFVEARTHLHSHMEEWDIASHDADSLEDPKPILDWLLGGNYTGFEEARWQLCKYGMRASKEEV